MTKVLETDITMDPNCAPTICKCISVVVLSVLMLYILCSNVGIYLYIYIAQRQSWLLCVNCS